MQPPRRPCDERNSQQVGNLNLGHDGRFAKSNDELIGRRLESDSTDLLYARKFTLSDVTSYYSQVTISPTANDEGESRSLELVNFMRTVRNLLFIWIWKWKFIIVCLDFE